MAGKIAGLVGIFLAVRLDAGLVGLVIALFGIPLIPLALSGVQLFFVRRPWLKPMLRSANPQIIRSLMKLGWLFFVLQLASTLAYSIDNLVITQVISPEAVTHYAIPAQLFKLSTAFIALLSLPLWPAYGEALARGDGQWVRQTFRRSLNLIFLLSVVSVIVLIMLAPTILRIWVGRTSETPIDLLIALAIWSVIMNMASATSILLNSASVIRFQVYCASTMAVANLALSVFLTHQWGISGVVWGSIISFLIFVIVPYTVYLPRFFASSRFTQQPANVHQVSM
jgi:O-antigen/teichoic acid export membrane protein